MEWLLSMSYLFCANLAVTAVVMKKYSTICSFIFYFSKKVLSLYHENGNRC